MRAGAYVVFLVASCVCICVVTCLYVVVLFVIVFIVFFFSFFIGWRFNVRERKVKPLRASQSLSETFPCTGYKMFILKEQY